MPDFLQTFTDRRQCFVELLLLSREQLSLIDGDDYQRLLAVQGSKQRIIGRLEEIAKAAPRLGQEWKNCRDQLAPADRKACEAALAETEAILAALLEQERISTEYLQRRRDETQLQIAQLTAGEQAQSAYRDSLAPVTHRHLDINQ